jgi:hypothetical protein
MNGGVLHAAELLDELQFAAAKTGYKYFGLDQVADLISQAKDALGKVRVASDPVHWFSRGEIEVYVEYVDDELSTLEPLLNAEYDKRVPDEAALFERFERYLTANPSDFTEVSDEEAAANDY